MKKQNKFSLFNINVNKYYKYVIIVMLTVLVIGSVIFATIGFNKTIEYGGGNLIEIKFGQFVEEEDLKNYQQNVKDILKLNNIKGFSLNVNNGNANSGFSIKTKCEVKENLISAFETNLNANNEFLEFEVTSMKFKGDGFEQLLLTTGIALMVAIIAIFVYIFFRFELFAALVVNLVAVFDVMFMLAFTAIFRIQVDSYVLGASVLIFMFSIFNNLQSFNYIRENLNNENFSKTTNSQIVTLEYKQNIVKKLCVFGLMFFASILLLVFGGTSLRMFSLICLIGVITSLINSVFVTTQIWAMMYNKEKDKRLENRIAKKNKPVIVKKDDDGAVV